MFPNSIEATISKRKQDVVLFQGGRCDAAVNFGTSKFIAVPRSFHCNSNQSMNQSLLRQKAAQ